MKSLARKILACAVLAGLCVAAEELKTEESDWTIKPGSTLRLRYDYQSDECKDPTGHKTSGGKKQYGPHGSDLLDFRTKVWLDIKSQELGLSSRIHIANRAMYYFADWSEKNNYGPSHHCFPNTLFFNELWVQFDKLGIDGLSIKLGRQEITLGNRMILRDGCPGDWPLYYNGAVITYKTDNNNLKTLMFYDYWRDPLSVNLRYDREDYVSGRGRANLPGNVGLLGLYDTYTVNDKLKFDAYYMFDNAEADRNGRLERKMPNNWDQLNMHTVGMRLFGDVCPDLAYSVEYAHQAGEWKKDGVTGTQYGNMTDWRLDWKLYETFDILPDLKPTLDLSYTYWSGNEGHGRTYDGWYSLHTAYSGLFGGEELSTKGGVPCTSLWTNIHAYHADFQIKPTNKLTMNTGSTYFVSDVPSDSGRYIGTTIYENVSYKFNKHFNIKVILSHMFYGEYYGPDRNDGAFWGRVELNYTF